jgi:hypothetical protein
VKLAGNSTLSLKTNDQSAHVLFFPSAVPSLSWEIVGQLLQTKFRAHTHNAAAMRTSLRRSG